MALHRLWLGRGQRLYSLGCGAADWLVGYCNAVDRGGSRNIET